MVINISNGTDSISSLSSIENVSSQPDDRLELVKLINGVTIQDGWNGIRKNVGDILSLSATFTPADFETLKAFWANRTKVTVQIGEEVIENATIVIKSYNYISHFESYKNVSLEIWRV